MSCLEERFAKIAKLKTMFASVPERLLVDLIYHKGMFEASICIAALFGFLEREWGVCLISESS